MDSSKMYSVYDSKVEAYLTPFFMRTRGEAIRAFMSACQDPNTQFNKYPGDFTLFEIGEYNYDTAKLISYETFVNLGTAIEFKKTNNIERIDDKK